MKDWQAVFCWMCTYQAWPMDILILQVLLILTSVSSCVPSTINLNLAFKYFLTFQNYFIRAVIWFNKSVDISKPTHTLFLKLPFEQSLHQVHSQSGIRWTVLVPWSIFVYRNRITAPVFAVQCSWLNKKRLVMCHLLSQVHNLCSSPEE